MCHRKVDVYFYRGREEFGVCDQFHIGMIRDTYTSVSYILEIDDRDCVISKGHSKLQLTSDTE